MKVLHYLFISILLIAFHTQAVAVCCQVQANAQQLEHTPAAEQLAQAERTRLDHTEAEHSGPDCHGVVHAQPDESSTQQSSTQYLQGHVIHDGGSNDECECDHCVVQLPPQSLTTEILLTSNQVNSVNLQPPHNINTGIDKPPRYIFL